MIQRDTNSRPYLTYTFTIQGTFFLWTRGERERGRRHLLDCGWPPDLRSVLVRLLSSSFVYDSLFNLPWSRDYWVWDIVGGGGGGRRPTLSCLQNASDEKLLWLKTQRLYRRIRHEVDYIGKFRTKSLSSITILFFRISHMESPFFNHIFLI